MLVIENRPHRPLADLIGVLPLAWHDSVLLKDRSLHRTRGGSAIGSGWGERKTITALFADIKGSVELMQD